MEPRLSSNKSKKAVLFLEGSNSFIGYDFGDLVKEATIKEPIDNWAEGKNAVVVNCGVKSVKEFLERNLNGVVISNGG